MNLYEIDANIQKVIEDGFVVDEDGVITFDESNLEELQEALDTKLENIALYIKDLEAEGKAFKDEEDALKKRRETREKKAEKLKAYLLGYLEKREKEKFETTRVVAKVTKGEAVEVDMDKLPEQYMTIKTELKPDKKALKEALKGGAEIEGAKLVQSRNINIK